MFATFAIITAVCVLANIAYSVLLTSQEILKSDAVAVVSFQAFIYEGWSKSSRKIVAISLINRARITAHNTATHMQLIGYKMLDVSHLCALQLSSRQHYIARTGPFYVAFWLFTIQLIKLQHFLNFCYAAIAHIAFNACLTTYILLLYANVQRFISNGWCSKVEPNNSAVKRHLAFNCYEPIACFGMSIL